MRQGELATMVTSRQHTCGFRITALCVPVLITLLISQSVQFASAGPNATSTVITHGTTGDAHSDNSSDEHEGGESEPHTGHGGVHVASWNLEYVKLPLTVTGFALFVGVAKIGFHHADFLSAIFPESVLLIVMGVIFGGIAFATGNTGSLQSETFFLYLLPPIILEASYSLHDRTFLDNLISILMYAVVGTLINTFLIGLTLYGISLTGAYGDSFTINLIECLVFSSLISAVDPVAVLAIFQEIHVNHVLYFLVFGESLLNDAVTVVLYNMMNSLLSLDSIPASQIVLGFVSFFTVSLGGAAIGIIVGLVTAFLTKFTKHVRVVEPLAILGMAYLSYLLAELFHFSGIISIICCGLAQVQYAFDNISRKSSTTVTYFTKMLSTTTESLIFLQLGQTLWAESHQWNTGFVIFTLLFIFVYRAFGVVVITFIVNKFRITKINKEEQFIMSYGGLRGAVAFSLVATLRVEDVPIRNALVTTTLVVILVTVFLQGITIKPLVRLFRIKRTIGEEPTVSVVIHQTVIDYVMAGIEEVIGHKGHNYFRMWLESLDNRFMKKYLQREPTSWEDEVMKTFEKITNHDHHNHIFKLSRGKECRKGSEPEIEKFKPMLTRGDSYFDSLRRRKPFKKTATGEYTAISDKATPADVAGVIRKNPSHALHEKYDKNLLKDDSQDLPLLMRQRSQEHVLARERILAMSVASKWKKSLRGSKSAETAPETIAEESGCHDGSTGEDDRAEQEKGKKLGEEKEEIGIQGPEDKDPNISVVKADLEINNRDADTMV
ncbi:sodium/hydrogen exchanger 1-like isoform X2 [Acanthaster planci]|uniref:Sodium/hydrogen exchanger n=1 Tax=Acanthaster planci TaxID=133434 RepID=A0A8B7Z654_ACAPL|nr:sodium/hydrogen exchanger 1-like isoform X2 [Acanthaster planci]